MAFLNEDGVAELWKRCKAVFARVSHTHTASEVTGLGNLAVKNTDGSTANYLRGDGTWATPPNDNTHKTWGLSISGHTVSIVDGGANKSVTVPDNNTWNAMKGATASAAGSAGYVPAPAAGAANRYLRSDGAWAVPPDSNTTYALSLNGSTVTLTGSDGKASSVDVPSGRGGAQRERVFSSDSGTTGDVPCSKQLSGKLIEVVFRNGVGKKDGGTDFGLEAALFEAAEGRYITLEQTGLASDGYTWQAAYSTLQVSGSKLLANGNHGYVNINPTYSQMSASGSNQMAVYEVWIWE